MQYLRIRRIYNLYFIDSVMCSDDRAQQYKKYSGNISPGFIWLEANFQGQMVFAEYWVMLCIEVASHRVHSRGPCFPYTYQYIPTTTLYFFFYIYFACLSVRLYYINVKTAKFSKIRLLKFLKIHEFFVCARKAIKAQFYTNYYIILNRINLSLHYTTIHYTYFFTPTTIHYTYLCRKTNTFQLVVIPYSTLYILVNTSYYIKLSSINLLLHYT